LDFVTNSFMWSYVLESTPAEVSQLSLVPAKEWKTAKP
jgi:hypothetical protein